MRAINLVNQHTGFEKILPVFIEQDYLDYETVVIFRKMFGEERAYVPTLFVDDYAFYYYGLPPWLELYATLMKLTYKHWR